MSIKRIAEMTGASPATISRVLGNPNYKCAKEGLREKIWKAAMDINYVPNEAARNLKRGVAGVGLDNYNIDILMTRTEGAHSDPFFDELLRNVESQIHSHNCILSGVWHQSSFSDDKKCQEIDIPMTLKTLLEDTEYKKDGLIIIGKCNARVIKALRRYYKNMVSINRNSTNYEIDEVICDGVKIASMAVEYLVKQGHTQIAYIGRCHGEARYMGYQNVIRKNNIDFYPEYIMDTRQTEKEGFDAMKKFMTLDEPPTAIYCANDISAVGVLKCLRQYKNQLYTPSVIASDDIEEGEFTKPMLSTVHLPKENMARFAVDILLDRIMGKHTEIIKLELEGSLLIRSSCYSVDEVNLPEYCI